MYLYCRYDTYIYIIDKDIYIMYIICVLYVLYIINIHSMRIPLAGVAAGHGLCWGPSVPPASPKASPASAADRLRWSYDGLKLSVGAHDRPMTAPDERKKNTRKTRKVWKFHGESMVNRGDLMMPMPSGWIWRYFFRIPMIPMLPRSKKFGPFSGSEWQNE